MGSATPPRTGLTQSAASAAMDYYDFIQSRQFTLSPSGVALQLYQRCVAAGQETRIEHDDEESRVILKATGTRKVDVLVELVATTREELQTFFGNHATLNVGLGPITARQQVSAPEEMMEISIAIIRTHPVLDPRDSSTAPHNDRILFADEPLIGL